MGLRKKDGKDGITELDLNINVNFDDEAAKGVHIPVLQPKVKS